MSLKKLFNDINKTYEKREYTINKLNKNINYMLNDSSFIIDNIKNKINNNYNNTYLIETDNNKIYFINNSSRLDKELVNLIINRVISFKKYSKNNIENKIYLWLVNDKKYLPKRGEIIDKVNVNSASCNVYDPSAKINGNIYIWRKEEMQKILLHELLHSLQYDYYSQNKKLDNMIKKEFNVNNHLNVNESYTEVLATVLNCIYYTLEHDRSYEYFIALLMNEINHANMQVNKILKHNNYMNIGQLMRKNDNKIFHQKTSVFSYYILKSMLLNNIIQFMKFAMKNNLKYPKNGNKQYYNLIMNSCNDGVYCIINKPFNTNNSSNLKMTIT